MSNLIKLLNENLGKAPDEVVRAISDPLARPISASDLGLKRFREAVAAQRRVHFLCPNQLNRPEDGYFSDSEEGGEILRATFEDWTAESHPNNVTWRLISAEAYPRLNLRTLEMNDEQGAAT